MSTDTQTEVKDQVVENLLSLLVEIDTSITMSYRVNEPQYWRNQLIEKRHEILTRNNSITDEERILRAVRVYGTNLRELPRWDDGFGPLWGVHNEFGIIGVVRAKNFDSAYQAAVDEIAFDYDVNGLTEQEVEDCTNDGCAAYRGSGNPSNPKLKSILADTEHLMVRSLVIQDGVYIVKESE